MIERVETHQAIVLDGVVCAGEGVRENAGGSAVAWKLSTSTAEGSSWTNFLRLMTQEKCPFL